MLHRERDGEAKEEAREREETEAGKGEAGKKFGFPRLPFLSTRRKK